VAVLVDSHRTFAQDGDPVVEGSAPDVDCVARSSGERFKLPIRGRALRQPIRKKSSHASDRLSLDVSH
jgi:hypothetical protein